MTEQSPIRAIIRNGTVMSCDDQMTEHEAVVLEGGHVLAVGTDTEMRALAGSGAETVDADGAIILPGIVDTHPHMMHGGIFRMNTVPLFDARNFDDIVERISTKAKQTAPGEWIIASPIGEPTYFIRRWYHDLEEGRMPDHRILDRATDRHPVCIWAMAPRTPNVVSFNSMGLNRVRIHSLTPDRVCNVEILKDAHGYPTGVVCGSVADYFNPDPYWQQILSHLPDVRGANEYEGGIEGMKFYNRLGVTSAYEGHGMTLPQLEAYRKLRHDGGMTLRVVASLELSNRGRDPHEEPTPECIQQRLETGLDLSRSDASNQFLKISGVTLCRSGPCGTGVLRWHEPYKLPFGGETCGYEWVPKWA